MHTLQIRKIFRETLQLKCAMVSKAGGPAQPDTICLAQTRPWAQSALRENKPSRAGEMAQQVKDFLLEREDLGSEPRHIATNPALGSWSQADPEGSLAAVPAGPLSFKFTKRLCLNM